MVDKALFDVIYKCASHIKGSPLNEVEKKRLIDEFHKADGDGYKKALTAIKKVVRPLVESDLSRSANLDNAQRLLNDLKIAASTWGKK